MARVDGRGISRIAGAVVSIGLGAMLLLAALLKAADPALFVDQIRGYGILPSLAPFGAHAFFFFEFLLGLLLVLRLLPRLALTGFTLLMLLFIGVTAWTWAHGNVSGCGCFGRLASRPPREVILEDSGYVVLAVLAFLVAPWQSPGRSFASYLGQRDGGGAEPRGRWIAFAILFLLLFATPWLAPRLPIDSWVTPLHPGVSLENLAADDLKTPLSDGSVLIAMLGKDCTACLAALPKLDALAGISGAPRITGIFAGDRNATRSWVLEHVPSFPMAHAPEKSLRQYYRKLPVFILLRDGRIRRIWWNRAPEPSQVMSAQG